MSYLDVALEHIGLARSGRQVLHDISWRVRPGQRWVLLGHNGAGKTQLLKLLAGDVWPTPSGRGSSRSSRARRWYRLGGERFAEPLGVKEGIAYVGAERQDKYARYDWNLTVAELIGTGVTGTDIVLSPPDRAGRERVARLIRRFALRDFAERRLLTMSYGERRLALIARALASQPRLLLLDEVFNGLDSPRRGQLMRALDATRRSQLPWVLSAHRREDVPASATHLLVLEKGRIRYSGRCTQVTLRRALDDRADGQRGKPARTGTTRKRAGRTAAAYIELRDVDAFVEHHHVLRGVSWTLRAGEHWAVLGRNGSGKSTLLKVLYGDLPPALGGAIERAGFPRGTPIVDFKRSVGFLSPELQAEHASTELTVDEIVMSGRHASIGLNDPPTPTDRRAARRWLEFFRLSDLASRPARELSYGQMRRVLLARAMAASPRLLLLDEPCTGLDPATRATVLSHLERVADEGVQLVMATHHAADIVPAITHVLRLRDGAVQEQGARQARAQTQPRTRARA
jgi:molybdate transport system ATP-binding protein